ncbi:MULTISPECIES: UDP-N-acetylmuramoyl-tripeptide--D-alanyl-D-alanine ligase [unclassified Brenneria]|uniref:UDP-N-acetylmuramoyl-tripeptide--D-alanyl-D- alanine ligase n=1 Tax=unclassified Brenneria TaxID=2634434 RepID=UPI0029C2CA5E|nr:MULTISPECIES: UDP-N-acetylmuramoyl-tripeptide--D-alanyl-D-alanine ligase [unclassified Brenneria]MDX5628930.1 UDP-N-acetylmuramoyl-tripeptide--D-alanyl-D-alanine ligase [Brenneria sp. L3-3Z]MDX5696069.1 UDP-N-acetylmuramoyl-tripeptide--D-alanyl-D-alanine ligase [Brenneria sp. L4-2C]
MIRVSLQQIASVVSAELIGENVEIDEVSTDTRKLKAGCLFVALKGEKFDAHDYADAACQSGAAALLVSKRLPVNAPQLLVKDTRLALGKLAGWVREQSGARVVALTGSSGKTSVKEMTAAILRQCGNVLYTAGNFNNDIGVPLTLLRLTPEHQFAVIELGANHIGEIAYTTDLVRPESALVNNLAAAHLEGFGSLAGVAQAKGEIFAGLPADGVAIINADSNDFPHWQTILNHKTLWRFAAQAASNFDFFASDVRVLAQGTAFNLHTPFGQIEAMLPLPGRHNVANALAATALAMSVGATLAAVKTGLAQIKAVPGRLFPIVLAEGKLLLDDSYNANVGSMTAAAQVLAEMPGYRVMVVGDMGELGEQAAECHRQVGEAARAAGIDKVLSVGTLSELIGHASGKGEHFQNKAALVSRLGELVSEHKIISILVKGSRSAAMEQVVRALQENATC